MRVPKVQLIYLNAGGGHRAAAQALDALIQAQGRRWDVEHTDLSQVLQPGGGFKRVTGLQPEDLYNKRLARGWTWGMKHELRIMQAAIRFVHPTLLRTLQSYWAGTEPDLVVSLIPNFNRALRESLQITLPGVPFLTVMTDLADCPPHFWIEPGAHQHLVVGTPEAQRQALDMGLAAGQITQASGMILRTEFYQPRTPRQSLLPALGFNSSGPVGLVMFGGWGSKAMLGIGEALHDKPLIFICGHNLALATRLRAQRDRLDLPHVIVEHTPTVHRYMDACDFLIGKPGPGSLSEALRRGLPVLTWMNAATMPQERYNAQWVREQGVGVVLSSPRQVREGLDRLMAGLPSYARAAARQDNRAVYEVVDLMARLLADSQQLGLSSPVRPSLEGEVWRQFEAVRQTQNQTPQATHAPHQSQPANRPGSGRGHLHAK
jgi:Monogalactosyldiacylglycerol (MGDG) synthase/Glycosyltransferase family 28 C-terminal domain